MILAARSGRDVALRRDVSLGSMIRAAGYGRDGGAVTTSGVIGLPAWRRALAIATSGVAGLDLRVWRGRGVNRRTIDSTWQARFFAGVPNAREPWVTVLAQTEASMTNANNAYWLKARDPMGRVAEVYVLDPCAVTPRKGPDGRLEWRYGSTIYPSADVLHFRALHLPGVLVDPSPIELARTSLGSALAKVRYEGDFYQRGLMNALAVTFPGEVGPDKARRYRESFESEHSGVENASKLRVFGGGATVATVGLSLRDSLFVDSMNLSAVDVARLTDVPASLIDAGRVADANAMTPEHEQTRWLRYGLGPRLRRIEEYVRADIDFFGPGARDYPAFDQDRIIRGDLTTEAEVSLRKVQSGQWTVDEARALDGLPPLPDGLGSIPQIVPVGGTPAGMPLPIGG